MPCSKLIQKQNRLSRILYAAVQSADILVEHVSDNKKPATKGEFLGQDELRQIRR